MARSVIFRNQQRGAPAAPASPDVLRRIGGETIEERLRSACDAIGGRIVFTTSFGIEDQLIAHHVFGLGLPIEVVTLDTGRLFPSTYKLWQETEEKYGARVRAFYPDAQALADLVADQGINGFYHSRDARTACCNLRKVEPLRLALEGAAAWVTGLRVDQSRQRANAGLASFDDARALVKIAPMFDWNRERVVRACETLQVPVNPLHAKGYLSIGCEPCTRAVRPGEPERSGRWWWEEDETRECGLHVEADGRLTRSRAA